MSQPAEEALRPPPMSDSLASALDSMKPVRMRRPFKELVIFSLLSLVFFAVMTLATGTRSDLEQLNVGLILAVGGLWFASFGAAAYLGFVPAKGHVAPRSRTIGQVVATCSLLLIAVGLFASVGSSFSPTYDPTVANVAAHARGCSVLGVSTGILPGILALWVMRRFVPVGRASIGLSLGAAGGSLAGLALLFHCPIAERFHVGLVHGGIVVIAALFVAGAAQLMLRER